MLSFAEIVKLQIGSDVLLIAKNCILGLIWENDSRNIFDSYSKDENISVSSSGIAGLLKFDTLHSLENYLRSVYYYPYPLTFKCNL